MQYQHKSQISSVTPTLQMEDLSKPQIIHSLTSHLNGKDKLFMGSCSSALAATFCLSETRVTLEKKKKTLLCKVLSLEVKTSPVFSLG